MFTYVHQRGRESSLFLLVNVKKHVVEHVTLGMLDILCRGAEASVCRVKIGLNSCSLSLALESKDLTEGNYY